MGKIRVKTLGDEQAEQEQKKKARKRKEDKKTATLPAGRQDTEAQKKDETQKQPEVENLSASEKLSDSVVARKVSKKPQPARERSKRYKEVKALVDRTKKYPVSQALELLPQVHLAKFDETVELHVNTTEPGVSGNLTLPHGTGKKTKVAIATDELIEQIEKGLPAGRQGTIDFDMLVATPDMMPKLAKVAKVLGPRGLMPNPKNGTISANPEEVVKKYEGGQMRFKTESKLPVIHLTVGKLSFGNKKLSENIETVLKAIQTAKIRSAILKSTMSPGIKIEVV